MLIGKENYKVGMIVYGEPYGNYARRDKSVLEFEVVGVSRKYAELKRVDWNTVEKCIMSSGVIEGFNAGYNIYGSIEDYNDKVEASRLKIKLKSYFDYGSGVKLTLDQMKRIDNIIKEGS